MSTHTASQSVASPAGSSSTFTNSISVKCPACGASKFNTNPDQSSLTCLSCELSFPVIQNGRDRIPWLFEQSNLMLAEWKARLNGFLHINKTEQHRLKEALKDKRVSKTGQKRFNKILQAKRDQASQALSIIEPLHLDSTEQGFQNTALDVLQSKVPKVQGLSNYYDNIFRDWAWDNGENEEMFKAIKSVLDENDSLGKIITLGSGAGRLSYDVHYHYKPELSVLVDINPLLLLTSSCVIQGQNLELYEFPIAPLNKNSFAVLQKCRVPDVIDEGVHFLFADAMNPPFINKSIDTVLTPWLLDIIPQNLREFIPRINQILKIGGRWLNTGSLAFTHKDQAWSYSEEELLELLNKNGFKIIANNRKKLSYLNSPNSAHGRIERVFNFSVEKVKDVVVQKKYDYLPSWIKDMSKPIPKSYDIDIESSRYLLQAQVLGAINGERSIEELGSLVAKQYSLSTKEAIIAVRRILIDNFESAFD